MKRRDNTEEITTHFSWLDSKVKLLNSLSLTDINSSAEDFFAALLNKVLGLNLVNLNLEKKNFEAIDLGDDDSKVCFQVTSTKTKAKIESTLKKFNTHNLGERFEHLRFVVITTDKINIKNTREEVSASFNPQEDILNLSDLTALIQKLPLERQEEIIQFLRTEIGLTEKNNESNEVRTLIDLVDFLSRNKAAPNKEWVEEPDPEGKIRHRFAEHSEYLESEIKRLIPIYSSAKKEVWEVKGYDLVDVEHITIFLKNLSESTLNRCNGDPVKALDEIVDYLEEKLGQSSVKYDNMAIRFYVIDELIKCNIFPQNYADK